MIHERYLKVGEVGTHFLEAGVRGHPLLVLVHDGAYGADATIAWERLIPLLSDQFHIIAPDLLGWGRSDATVIFNRDRFEFRARHIAALLETLDLADPAHFMGTSFGGSLILHTLIAHPRYWNVASAVSITGDGGAFRHPENFARLLQYDGSRSSMASVVDALIDVGPEFDRQVDYRQASVRRPGVYQALSAVRLPSLDDADNAGSAPAADGYLEGLGSVECPLLLIAGDRDPVLLPEWPERLQEHTPARVIRFDSKHAPNIDHADELASAVVDFFNAAGS